MRRGPVWMLTFVVAACGIDIVGIVPLDMDAGPDARPTSSASSTGGTSSGSTGTGGTSGGSSGTSGTSGTVAKDSGVDATLPDFSTGSSCTSVKRITTDTLVAHKATADFKVDDSIDEWPCDWRVKFRGTPDNAANGQSTSAVAETALAWSDMGLYFMAFVSTQDGPSGNDGEPYQNDAAEFYFAKVRGAITADDVHFVSDYSGATKWYPMGKDVGDPVPGGITHTVKRTDNRFFVEAFFPKETLKLAMLNKGDAYNFEVQIDQHKNGDGTRPAFWVVRTQQDDGACGEPHCSSNMWGKVQFADP